MENIFVSQFPKVESVVKRFEIYIGCVRAARVIISTCSLFFFFQFLLHITLRMI